MSNMETSPSAEPADLSSRLELAKQIAVEAGKLTLNYFQTDRFEVQHKQDGSPLTIADQESEKFLRAEIQKQFPDDAIVGEEFGTSPGTTGYCWALDPIDGTKSFISGVPLYGTMVGVLLENDQDSDPGHKNSNNSAAREAVIGAVYLPGLDEGIFAAVGSGAWHFRGNDQPVRARVSTKQSLSKCVMASSSFNAFSDRGARDEYQQLADTVYFGRTWGDVYGYLLVATGRIDVMIDPQLNIWDAAAVKPIVEEAGGRFTDWLGGRNIDAGESIGSNGLIHDKVLAILSTAPRLPAP